MQLQCSGVELEANASCDDCAMVAVAAVAGRNPGGGCGKVESLRLRRCVGERGERVSDCACCSQAEA